MSTLLNVHLLDPPEAKLFAHLKSLLDPEITITTGENWRDHLQTQILVTGTPNEDQIQNLTQLHTVIIPYAGLLGRTRKLLLQYPQLAVHNLHHNDISASELAIALLLAASKQLIPAHGQLSQGDWSYRHKTPDPTLILSGKTAVILGYGAIGQRVGRVCQALGMKVKGVRRSIAGKQMDGNVEVYPSGEWQCLLPQAQALFICLPLTGETKHLLGVAELAKLPAQSVLVNLGRGPIVEEEALYQALKAGTVGAAGLDVWYQYPRTEEDRTQTLPSKFSFHQLENVVMSPHRGGAFGTWDIESRRMEGIAELLNAARRGETLPRPVDVDRGY